jgi:hypothetical protein
MIEAETPVDQNLRKEIEFIQANCDESILDAKGHGIPLSVVELAIFRNWHKPFNYEIEIYKRNFTIADLHRLANIVLARVVRIVTSIAKKYSLEFQIKKGESAEYAAELKL